jgi:integrase
MPQPRLINGSKPVRVNLKGIHKVKRRLASGDVREHFYAWRGGPALEGTPGSPEFMRSYQEAIASRSQPGARTVAGLVSSFQASTAFTGLAPSTRKGYLRYLDMIRDEFGTMPTSALDDPRVRGVFKRWRDSLADKPRRADYAMSVLARVLSVAFDNGDIAANPMLKPGRIYTADRQDKIYTEGHLGRLLAVASPPERLALVLALWTGQREGDLIRITWGAISAGRIEVKQRKRGHRVSIPIGKPLEVELASTPRRALTILVNQRGIPWTESGFRQMWRKLMARAGITDDLHFHDLRGTTITRLIIAGCSAAEVAKVAGLSLQTVSSMLDNSYLSRSDELAENAIRKLETGTKSVNGV